MARNFPIRILIIIGLSIGVVFNEVLVKCGVNITATYALMHNHEVFAMPGPRVDSEASTKNNRLIYLQHAKLNNSSSDIIEELSLCFPSEPALPFEQPSQLKRSHLFSHEEWLVLLQIEQGIENLDNLNIQKKIPMSLLLGVLLVLELEGIIKQNQAHSYFI